MITNQNKVGNAAAIHASAFNPSRLSTMMANRNNHFHLDLSKHTLVGVLNAYAAFKQKNSPRFRNSAIISAVEALQKTLKVVDPECGELMPIDVTDIFYEEFKQFLLTRPGRRDMPLKPNTIKNYFDNIRATLGWAALHCCPVSETYNSYDVDDYETTKVSLSVSQLAYIYSFDVELNKPKIRKLLETYPIHRFSFTAMSKVKDQFVLEANTAQRYSDASRISSENFDDTRTILKMTQQKTGGKARVNIPEYSIDKKITFAILQKYNFEAPTKGMDLSNFNKYLHLLLLAIGGDFLEPVIIENKINGEIVTEQVPKWKLITSHTARRTFVTHNVKEGKNLPKIQRCTGHKDLRHLQTYCVLDDDD